MTLPLRMRWRITARRSPHLDVRSAGMAKTKAGDWRDPVQVKQWATAIAAELTGTTRAA